MCTAPCLRTLVSKTLLAIAGLSDGVGGHVPVSSLRDAGPPSSCPLADSRVDSLLKCLQELGWPRPKLGAQTQCRGRQGAKAAPPRAATTTGFGRELGQKQGSRDKPGTSSRMLTSMSDTYPRLKSAQKWKSLVGFQGSTSLKVPGRTVWLPRRRAGLLMLVAAVPGPGPSPWPSCPAPKPRGYRRMLLKAPAPHSQLMLCWPLASALPAPRAFFLPGGQMAQLWCGLGGPWCQDPGGGLG